MKAIGTHQLLLEHGETPETVAAAIFGRTEPGASQLRRLNQNVLEAHRKDDRDPERDFGEGDVLAIPPGWQPRAHEILGGVPEDHGD